MISIVPGGRLLDLCIQRFALRRWFDKEAVTAADGTDETHLAFSTLGRAVGLDPRLIRVAIKWTNAFGAWSFGEHRFVVGRSLTKAPRDVLWGVIAHEIAHDHLGHVGTLSKLEIGRAVFDLVTGPPSLLSVQLKLLQRKYPRSQEYEADDYAVKVLRLADSPRWLLRYALEFIWERYGDTGGGWFSTHPLTADRIARQPEIIRSV
jgi:Zn-dependent protease with chaperone function